MSNATEIKRNTKLVKNYFALIAKLRSGDSNSVNQLMAMWSPDGVFEFAGSEPLTATYKGEMAIRTLYKNRLNSSGMEVSLDMGKKSLKEVSLGVVETNVTHIREKEGRLIAGWITTIGTQANQGFDVTGSHLFTFDEAGAIKKLKVNISPKATQSTRENLTIESLSVQDVGRLSLAAWPVV